MEPDEMHYNGCLAMFGAHVNMCLRDLTAYRRLAGVPSRKLSAEKNQRKKDAQTAYAYIFGGGIEYHEDLLCGAFNAGYVRAVARGVVETGVFNTSWRQKENAE